MVLVVELESNSELQCGKHTVITSYEITSTESIDMNGIFCLYALMSRIKPLPTIMLTPLNQFSCKIPIWGLLSPLRYFILIITGSQNRDLFM